MVQASLKGRASDMKPQISGLLAYNGIQAKAVVSKMRAIAMLGCTCRPQEDCVRVSTEVMRTAVEPTLPPEQLCLGHELGSCYGFEKGLWGRSRRD